MVEITPDNVRDVLAALIAKTGHVAQPNDSAPADAGGPAADRESLSPEPVTEVAELLKGWASSIRGLTKESCATLSDRDLTDRLIEADRLRRASDAAYLRLVAEVDAREAAPASRIGAVSTANLLTAGCGAAPGRAKADLDAAHALYTATIETSALVPTCRPGPLAGMAELLESGAIRLAHVDTAVRTLERIPERLARVGSDRPDDSPADSSDGQVPDTEDPDAEELSAEDPDAEELSSNELSAEGLGGDEPATEEPDIEEPGIEEPGATMEDAVADALVEFFASHAPTFSPRKMAELSEELIREIAPPGDDLYDPEAFNRRDLAVNIDLAGMVHGHYQLDADSGALFSAIINALSAPRPAVADSTGGHVVRDSRKPGQRRADALTEVVRLAAARLNIRPVESGSDATPDSGGKYARRTGKVQDQGLFDLTTDAAGRAATSRAGRVRAGRRAPRIVIITTEDQIRTRRQSRNAAKDPDCRYQPVDPSRSYSPGMGMVGAGMVARSVCDAVFERVTLDAEGAILDFGTGVRLATPRQRRALEVRDRGCTFPGCNRPASWCDAHHVIWFSRGGRTDTDNLALLCPAHHSLIHTGRWQMCMIHGIPYARSAPGMATPAIYGAATSDEGWIRNTFFDALADAHRTSAAIRRLATA